MKKVGLILIVLALTITSSFAESSFLDVEDHWGKSYIENLSEKDIINGYPNGTFQPDNQISVTEFVVLAIKSTNNIPQDDNPQDHWATHWIDYAEENELVEPYYFIDYERPITREEMADIAIRTLKSINESIETQNKEQFKTDITDLQNIKDNFIQSVLKAYKTGLITGMPNNTFIPKGNATRAEASVVILRLIDPTERATYNKPTEEEIKTPTQTGEVPQYLQERFDEIAGIFNLTWTDEDFKNWYETTPREIRVQYMNDGEDPRKGYYLFDALGNAPTLDFENKIALVDRQFSDFREDEEHINLNDYNGRFPIDNLGYIAYEVYKKNIELMIKDDVDFGQIRFTDELENRGLFYIQIEDKSNYKSLSIIGSDVDNDNDITVYSKGIYDSKLLTHVTSWESTAFDYVMDLTRLNILLLFGTEDGQPIYANYIAINKQKFVKSDIPNAEVDARFSFETENYVIDTSSGLGWYQAITKK